MDFSRCCPRLVRTPTSTARTSTTGTITILRFFLFSVLKSVMCSRLMCSSCYPSIYSSRSRYLTSTPLTVCTPHKQRRNRLYDLTSFTDYACVALGEEKVNCTFTRMELCRARCTSFCHTRSRVRMFRSMPAHSIWLLTALEVCYSLQRCRVSPHCPGPFAVLSLFFSCSLFPPQSLLRS